MAAASIASTPLIARAADEQRMLPHNVAWKDYVILRDVLDSPGVRMTYLDGALELMSLSSEHELWKKNIARLVERSSRISGASICAATDGRRSRAKRCGAAPSRTSVT